MRPIPNILVPCLVIFIGFHGKAPAQNQQRIDSLEKSLISAVEDSNKVNTYNRLGWNLRYNRNNDKALQYETKAIILAKALNFSRGLVFAHRNMGYIKNFRGKYQEALSHFDTCLKISQKIGYQRGIALAFEGIGYVQTDLGKASDGIASYEKALAIYRQTNNEVGMADIYMTMGNNYYVNGNYPEALNSFMLCRRMAEKTGDKGELGSAYFGLGLVYASQKNYQEALENYHAVIKICEERRDELTIAYAYNNMGVIYKDMENLSEALNYLNKALKMKEAFGDRVAAAQCLGSIGEIHTKLGNYDEAGKMFDKALKIIEENELQYGGVGSLLILKGNNLFRQAAGMKTPGTRYRFDEASQYISRGLAVATFDKEAMKLGYLYLSRIDSARGNFRDAFLHQKLYLLYKDSLLNEQSQNRIAKTRLDYETEKRDREIVLLAKEKKLREQQIELLGTQKRLQVILLAVSLFLVILMAVVVLVITRSRKRLQKAFGLVTRQKKEIELRNQEVEAQKEQIEQQKEEVECQKEELETTLEQLKNTQAQLIQSEKMASLGMLTAGIAHEINNPVNFINSGTISLQQDFEDLRAILLEMGKQHPGSADLAEKMGLEELLKIIPQTIEDVKTGVERTSEIVKGLRNFTRLDSAEMKEADIHEGLDSTLHLLNHKIKDRIRVLKDYDRSIGFIRCYPGPLNQVFMNLLNNAIDAIEHRMKRENGETGEQESGLPEEKGAGYAEQIRISTKRIEEGIRKQVRIEFEDNGEGIPESVRDKIFDPFFTTREVGKGTGLGLSICLGIVERHGGSITFHSEEGTGTTFTIILSV